MATEERLEQLEWSLTAAGTTTSAASMVDMRVFGKPHTFAGDEASWKSWSFVMLFFSAAVSPEQRALMEKARINVGHAERTSHLGRAGVEQTAALHAQSEHERRSAKETAERA